MEQICLKLQWVDFFTIPVLTETAKIQCSLSYSVNSALFHFKGMYSITHSVHYPAYRILTLKRVALKKNWLLSMPSKDSLQGNSAVVVNAEK